MAVEFQAALAALWQINPDTYFILKYSLEWASIFDQHCYTDDFCISKLKS